MEKPAISEYEIHPLIAQRWSPRAFAAKPLSARELRQIMEAARWAPSAYNAQPWFYLAATADEPAFQELLEGLVEANQAWAKSAGALLIGVAAQNYSFNGKPNAHAGHDLGQASAQLVLQALSMGIHSHQMAGIKPDWIREHFQIPAEYQPLTAIALGYPGEAGSLPEKLAQAEIAPRARKSQSEFVFQGAWNKAWKAE